MGVEAFGQAARQPDSCRHVIVFAYLLIIISQKEKNMSKEEKCFCHVATGSRVNFELCVQTY